MQLNKINTTVIIKGDLIIYYVFLDIVDEICSLLKILLNRTTYNIQ